MVPACPWGDNDCGDNKCDYYCDDDEDDDDDDGGGDDDDYDDDDDDDEDNLCVPSESQQAHRVTAG